MAEIRALWADDQVGVARTMSRLTEGLLTHITFVEDGDSALEALQNEPFDIVIADLRMPPDEWGGLYLLKGIGVAGLRVPVVILSGEGAQHQTIEALRLGAVDYVRKESAQTELRDRLAAALSGSRVIEHVVREAILGGENQMTEFKQSARWNFKRGAPDPEMHNEVVKTVAGFLNASGGLLLIGVHDSGTAFGLEQDYATFQGSTGRDRLENWLTSLLRDRAGSQAATLTSIGFAMVDGLDVCAVRVKPSPEPVFDKRDGSDMFFVRMNNSTRVLAGSDLVRYLRDRWPA